MAVGVTEYRSRLERLFEKTGGRVNPGLERTQQLLDGLGEPHRKFPAFHVAGTNGKGSTVATLDALLRTGSRRVGRYTSPHLIDFRERIVIDGVAIDPESVVRWLDRLEPEAERIGASFFEITTALAFAYFAEQGIDVGVIETGLGGRFDSTNVIDPLVAAVTNVSLDHTEYLGNTLAEIADEKAGIFKHGKPAVVGEPRAEVARRLAQRAVEAGATPIVNVRTDWRWWSLTSTGGKTSFHAATPHGELRVSTPLIGEHQARNTMVALATLDAAPAEYHVAREDLAAALANVWIPGRFQRVGNWIFDVAHNAAGAQALAATLTSRPTARPISVVLAVLKDKDWYGIIEALAPVADAFIITQPRTAPADRAWDPIPAAAHANALKVPVTLIPSFDEAIDRARELPGTRVVTGSFHTVGDAMAILGVDPLAEPRRAPAV